jgi:hypothetical protein
VSNYRQCDNADSSDRTNLAIAVAREQAVAGILRSKADTKEIEVRMEGWTTYEAMEQGRLYIDRFIDGPYSKERGVLTRRVEIQLISAAGCTP